MLDSPSVLRHSEVDIATHIYNAPDNSQEPKVLKLSLPSSFPFPSPNFQGCAQYFFFSLVYKSALQVVNINGIQDEWRW